VNRKLQISIIDIPQSPSIYISIYQVVITLSSSSSSLSLLTMQTDISEFKLLMFVLVREVPSKGKGSSWIDPSIAEVGMQKSSLCEMIVMIMMIVMMTMIVMSDDDGEDIVEVDNDNTDDDDDDDDHHNNDDTS